MQRPQSETLAGLIEELARVCADRPAVSFKGRTVTFGEFRQLAIACARALHAQGVQPGDKVGILLGNGIEWLVANFAAQYLGATMVAMNTWYTQRELAYVIEHSDTALLVCADRYLRTDYVEILDALQPHAQHFPLLRKVVMVGGRVARGALGWDDFLASGADVPDEVVLERQRAISPHDIAYLLYTSGSTAHPKGVMLLHKHLIGNMFDIGQRLHFTPDDAVYMPLSLFWGMGCMNMLLGPWTHRMHIVLQEHFDALEGLQLIDRYRCSVLGCTPNIIHALFDHPRRAEFDLSSMAKGTALGTPDVSLQLIRTVMPLGVRVYGMTETHGFAAMHDAGEPEAKRAATDGRVMPGFQMRLVDPETGRVIDAPAQVGEIRMRGRITAGYYKNPEATRAAWDDEGWFRSGDMGMWDADGYLLFLGRFKEMLKTGGINVAPIEVEEVLHKHPAVREAFVTGVPDPVREQVVAAIIVLREGATLSEDEVLRHCRAQLAAYKVPRRVRFARMEDIPHTTTRKVHRLKLASMFAPAE